MKDLVALFLCLAAFNQLLFAQNCDCASSFDFFSEKIKINYSGYRDKVKPDNQAEFDAHTARSRQLASAATSDTACFRILNDWKKWFRDGHVQLQRTPPPSDKPDSIRQLFASWEKIEITEAALLADFDPSRRAPIEGIWMNEGGEYRVALTRQPNAQRGFAASILKADSIWWTPGQMKFELSELPTSGSFSARYFMRDHSLQVDTATFDGDRLVFKKQGAWYRQFPGTPVQRPVARQHFSFKLLDETTGYLVVRTMRHEVRKQLDSLMQTDRKVLRKLPYLIIDVRGNGGGSDITFRKITPYLYTQPVRYYTNRFWATRDNAGKYEEISRDKNYNKIMRRQAKKRQKLILKNEGNFIGRSRIGVHKRRRIKEFPQRVAVLMDNHCASSCEGFVEIADQSAKVTLIGTNTAGISDYGNLHTLIFPCKNFTMRYPTTRTAALDWGKGIDNVGIPPDIRLPAEEKDWVEFARKYLKTSVAD